MQFRASAAQENIRINPWWFTGFSDAEGCFQIIILEKPDTKTGWRVYLRFSIGLSKKDIAILEKIKVLLGVGKINRLGPESVELRVESIKEIEILINHFDKFPLITQKRADYELFKRAYEIIKNKEHLTKQGIKLLVALKANQNLGLSDKLKLAFTDVIPVARPLVKDQTIKDANWLAGFTSGEGCYQIYVSKSNTHLLVFQVKLIFTITQHSRDKQLMSSFIKYLKCGSVNLRENVCDYRVQKLEDIVNKIIPFFNKYPILGVKALNFQDWCRVAELMKQQKHLTPDGLEQIRKIKAQMNKKK